MRIIFKRDVEKTKSRPLQAPKDDPNHGLICGNMKTEPFHEGMILEVYRDDLKGVFDDDDNNFDSELERGDCEIIRE